MGAGVRADLGQAAAPGAPEVAAIDQPHQRPPAAAPEHPAARVVELAAIAGAQLPGPALLRAEPQLGAVASDALQHPVQRQVRQAAVLAAAADVGMRAREPGLLDGPILAVARLGPHRRLELHALLVDGQRMTAVVDDAADIRVVELDGPPAEPAHRSPGMPSAPTVSNTPRNLMRSSSACVMRRSRARSAGKRALGAVR